MTTTKVKATPQLKGVIFDLGNTLLHFNGDWDEVAKELYSELYRSLITSGFDLDRAEFIPLFHNKIQTYFEDRDRRHIELTTAFILQNTLAELGFGQVTREELKCPLAEMYAISQHHWQLEDDAIPTLNTLQEVGYRIGMISNAGNDEDVQTLVDNARIRSYFDFILISAAERYRKPDPRIFQIALDNWGFSPDEIAMVGDTLEADILGAKNIGMSSIWITRRVKKAQIPDHRKTIHPDYEIASLADLPSIINRMK